MTSAPTRRRFIATGCAAVAGAFFIPGRSEALGYERTLTFHNIHTGEWLKDAVYWENGRYVTETLNDINRIFRDHRTGDIHEMDPKLTHILYGIRRHTGSDQAFNIISGYRSPKSNNMLRNKSSGVAKKSYHMLGQAVDINLEGVSVNNVRKAALAMDATGGVGAYGSSGFVHIDTGPRRTW